MDLIRQDRSGWQAVQDALAALAGVSLQVSGLHQTLCEASQENPICRIVHALPEGDRTCKLERTRHLLMALESRELVFFSCPANLHLFAIPLSLQNEDPQFLFGGKIYYSYSEFEAFQERAGRWGLDPARLTEAVERTPFGSANTLYEAARLIQVVGRSLTESSMLKKRFEGRAAQLTTLMRTQAELRSSVQRSALFQRVLDTLGVLYNVESGAILTQDPNRQTFSAESAFGKRRDLLLTQKIPLVGPLEQAIETGEAVSVDATSEILRMGLPADSGPVHLFPMRSGKGLHGILLLLNTPIRQEEMRVIETFNQQLSPLWENLELREDLHRRNATIQTVLEIANAMSAPQTPRDLVVVILEKASDFLQAEQASLMLFDEESNLLSVQAIKGLHKTLVELLRIKPGEGISGKVYESGLPLLVQDIFKDPRVPQPPRSRYRTGSFISAPLKLQNRTIGVINLADKAGELPFSEADLEVLTVIGAYASVAIERTAYYQKTEELRKISTTDPLTGLLNRRYFQERLTEEVERSRRYHVPVSLMMVDVDDFKGINDLFGHLGGDEVLKILTLSIRHQIRTIDVAARFGGEEFTIILPQTSKQDASIIAERICKSIEQNESVQEKLQGRATSTVSIGLATYPDDAATTEELVQHADEALYAAKARGKNQVVLYSPPSKSESSPSKSPST